MARFGGAPLGDGFYAEPEWWPEYLRLEREASELDGVDSRLLWWHVNENWREYVLPDLARFYPGLPVAEVRLLNLPWRALREYVLALFSIPNSLTGATFARQQSKE